MKVIVINEDWHGDIKICTDIRSAFEYLLMAGWLEGENTMTEIDRLMAEYEKDHDFLNDQFEFHEENVFQGTK